MTIVEAPMSTKSEAFHMEIGKKQSGREDEYKEAWHLAGHSLSSLPPSR